MEVNLDSNVWVFMQILNLDFLESIFMNELAR